MEILRFDESDVPAPKRKSASKGWLALGLVATLMGVGTAFASSTITIPTVSLGQGVAQVTNCDGRVSVSPEATGSVSDSGEEPVFRTTSLNISDVAGVGTSAGPGTTEDGCNNQDFGIQVFKKYNNSRPKIGDPEVDDPTYQDSNVRDDSFDISPIKCSDLNIIDIVKNTSTPLDSLYDYKCDESTHTLWISLGTLSELNDNALKIGTDFTNDIDYVTLVSSAHSTSRFDPRIGG